MKKEKIYIILIVILLVSIVGITVLKITYSVDDTNDVDNNINNSLVNSSWVKEWTEYHRDITFKYQDEPLENEYVDFKETSLELCNNNEDNEIECNEYNYFIKDDILTVYDSNNNEITYTYEIISSSEIVITYDNNGSVWTNYYSKALG